MSILHILIFSETHQTNELKLSRKHLWKVLSKECTFCYDPLPNMALHRQILFLIGQFLKSSSCNIAESGVKTPKTRGSVG
jgi:hypothetical protein